VGDDRSHRESGALLGVAERDEPFHNRCARKPAGLRARSEKAGA
jgi:hypothetical protein